MSKSINGLGKEERLKGHKVIDNLFSSGRQVFVFPFKLVYLPIPGNSHDNSNILFSVSVPKKKIKKAVDRNRIKRLIREAYRVNKPQFSPTLMTSEWDYALMYIYVGEENPDVEFLARRIRKLHVKWMHKMSLKVN